MPAVIRIALAVIPAIICMQAFPIFAGMVQTSDQGSSLSAGPGAATTPPPVPADAAPLPSPVMTGPLSARPPILFDAGPLGKLALDGVLSGFGVRQSNPVRNDQRGRGDLSNGQIVLQKTTGVAQFYLQAGAYNLLSLGTPVFSTQDTISDYYGPLPVAYFKLAPASSFSFLAGKLSSLLGGEYTYSFENINIERGLLWNQGSSVSRGVQLNYSHKKLSGSVSWNDGFYSNRWNWLTGALTYTFSSANCLEIIGGGNLGDTRYSSIATPAAQDNSSFYNVIYTHTAKNWTIQPYFQFTHVSEHPLIGIFRTSSTQGEAFLGYRTLPHHMSLGGRFEYISTTGDAAEGAANLLYGAGSNAISVTVTPTYQNKAFFARGEVSYVHAGSTITGEAFGHYGNNASQVRGVVEAGFLF